MWRGMEFHILGAATQKARAPKERLYRGTESEWLADERVDLAGLWYCKSSLMYGGWPVWRILWTEQESLNRICHSLGSQWSCLRSSVDVSGEMEGCCITTLASACCTRWRRAACFCRGHRQIDVESRVVASQAGGLSLHRMPRKKVSGQHHQAQVGFNLAV